MLKNKQKEEQSKNEAKTNTTEMLETTGLFGKSKCSDLFD